VPKILRACVVQGGKVIEEQRLRRREPLTVGTGGKNTFVIADPSLPRSHELFVVKGGAYELVLTEAMRGRVSQDNRTSDFAALKAAGSMQKQGDYYHLPLTEARMELLAGQYYHWDCDLKTAMEDLARLHDQVRRFAKKFLDNHGIELHFEPDAVDEILQQAVTRETSALAVCQEMAQDLEYALKLVRDRTSQDQFILTREALCDLDAYLNRVIQEHYQTTLFRE